MISLWPVRTDILVDDGVAYFAAGVFPYEGLYVCALRSSDGSMIWKNDGLCLCNRSMPPNIKPRGPLSLWPFVEATKELEHIGKKLLISRHGKVRPARRTH